VLIGFITRLSDEVPVTIIKSGINDEPPMETLEIHHSHLINFVLFVPSRFLPPTPATSRPTQATALPPRTAGFLLSSSCNRTP
jgi:hypothetical protein